MRFRNGQMIQVLRRGPRDREGDAQFEESHEIGPCGVEWDATDDISASERREGSVSNGRLLAPIGSDATATDRLEVEGRLCRVVGKPFVQQFGRSRRATNLTIRFQEVE
ncbi:hypothetical protein 7S3_8 [uncultured Caudovirales phage]|uniref:Head-to-tail stopper n=1 Tax=uncultured Caudovirales phage TaxID=2100421 RepID=A0A2H4J9J9_9CAUD|nr:hypothetical protein 7S3_8 [uncultured Caudovirales phage]